jgi:hypothetical protein
MYVSRFHLTRDEKTRRLINETQNTYVCFLVEKLFDGGHKNQVSLLPRGKQADIDHGQPYNHQTWIKAGIEAGPENVTYVALQSLAKGFFARMRSLRSSKTG